MGDSLCQEFQDIVSTYLMRHQSILDIMSKCQESASRVNRAVTKSITACGCLSVHTHKIPIPETADLSQLKQYYSRHLEGRMCPHCAENFEIEMGKALFYLTALCTALDVSLEDIMAKEKSKVEMLGKFNLT
jgi:hypothetical protein